MANAISPRRHQYSLQVADKRTRGQTEGHHHRVKRPLCGRGLITKMPIRLRHHVTGFETDQCDNLLYQIRMLSSSDNHGSLIRDKGMEDDKSLAIGEDGTMMAKNGTCIVLNYG